LVFDLVVAVAALIIGIAVMAYSSDKAVEHSLKIATALRISPLVIGLVLVSVGTDLPEIVNSITSSAIGHGDINIGNSLGSTLTQITLILGLFPFLAGKLRVNKREVLVIGACLVLSLILAVSIAEKGYVTRINALFLMASWIVFILLARSTLAKKDRKKEVEMPIADENQRHRFRHWIIAVLGFVGVAIGSYVVVQSVISLSASLMISEYILSFFLVAIGTSLPELVVTITALRKKQYALSIGNIIGSCLFDASFVIGIGLFVFPQAVSGGLAMTTGLYAIFGCIVALLLLATRSKIDRKAGVILIVIYLFSYSLMTL